MDQSCKHPPCHFLIVLTLSAVSELTTHIPVVGVSFYP